MARCHRAPLTDGDGKAGIGVDDDEFPNVRPPSDPDGFVVSAQHRAEPYADLFRNCHLADHGCSVGSPVETSWYCKRQGDPV